MVGLIWIQTIWNSDGIPERSFLKGWFWKKSADDKKSCKNFPGGKELYSTKWITSTTNVHWMTGQNASAAEIEKECMYTTMINKMGTRYGVNSIALGVTKTP